MRASGLLGILLLVGSGRAPAQERPTFSLRGDGAFVWVRSDSAIGGAARMRGPVLGGEGRVLLSGFILGVGFQSGTLQSREQSTVKRDLIEGRLIIGGRPLPWLEVSVGPSVRAYVTDTVTERWVFWQARARVDAPILTPTLTSYVELWRALSSEVNLAAGAGRVHGGEAGVVYRPPQRRFALRLAYRVDDSAVQAGGSETFEAISVSVVVGGR